MEVESISSRHHVVKRVWRLITMMVSTISETFFIMAHGIDHSAEHITVRWMTIVAGLVLY